MQVVTDVSDRLRRDLTVSGVRTISGMTDRLRREGIEVLDLSCPGWLATSENIATLLGKLEKIPCDVNDTLILDLYGNLSYRFKQFDGSISLPYKSKGRYHLAGNVVTCPLTSFKKVLENTTGVFSAKKDCDPTSATVSVLWLLLPAWSQCKRP